MGATGGSDCQNLGGVIRRGCVLATKNNERTPIAVPKRTRRRRVARRTERLPRNGSRGKDEAWDEPQGCASRRPLGAGESRNCKGSCPFCRLGIVCGDVLARFALRSAHSAQI